MRQRGSERDRPEKGDMQSTRASIETVAFNAGRMIVPRRAPAPRAPSETPYADGPPSSCLRTTSGKRAQTALPKRMKAPVRRRTD